MKRSEEIAKMIRKRICLLDYEKQKLKTTAELIARETGCDEPERWPKCKHGIALFLSFSSMTDEWICKTLHCETCTKQCFGKDCDSALAAFRAANKEQQVKDVPNE